MMRSGTRARIQRCRIGDLWDALREDRMETDIGIWEIDRASRAGTRLGLAEQVETEEGERPYDR